MSTLAPIVISSGSPPPGIPYDAREAAASRAFLESNGYAATRQGFERASESAHAVLRAAAFHLLAEDPREEEIEFLERGAADAEGEVRAWAAFGLEKLRPGAGVETLRALARQRPAFAEYGPLVAAAALARLGDPSGFATVKDAMESFDEPIAVVKRLYWFAALCGDELWPLYERALQDSTPGVRELALSQLRQLPDVEAAAVVERFAATHDPESTQGAIAREILSVRGGL